MRKLDIIFAVLLTAGAVALAYEKARNRALSAEMHTVQGSGSQPVQVVLCVRPDGTFRLDGGGQFVETGRHLDVAIQGRGFFRVNLPDSMGGGTGYTRDGEFFVNADGQIVDANGYGLSDGIIIPNDAISVTIQADGQVIANLVGGLVQNMGQIMLVDFVNPDGLEWLGRNVFIESDASGSPVGLAKPGTRSLGQLRQYFLEASSVQLVRRLVGSTDMVSCQVDKRTR